MERPMAMRILLIEPYDDLSRIIGLCLEDLGHEFDLVADARACGGSLAEGRYGCILINVDQNSDRWRDHGLRLAESASRNHTPVVMIADHELDDATAKSKGWMAIRKPFTLEKLKAAIAHAVATV
jgi:DNA-binding NtrC family response regulator